MYVTNQGRNRYGKGQGWPAFFKPILEPFDLRKNPGELYRYYLFSLHN